MSKRRVVVTGVGMVTALGNNVRDTWEGLLAGRSGVVTIDRFNTTNFTTTIAAQVQGFDPMKYVDKKEVKKMDLFIHYAIAAADEAVIHSALKISEDNSERVGVYIGSGIGGFGIIEREHETMLTQGPRRVSPFFIPSSIVNLAAGQVSIRFGARGPNSAPCTACASGTHAIGDAFKVIQRGDADVMIAGGTEGAITPMGVGGFCAMRALSTRNHEPEKASRPFDKERDGFVIGEGAGILILEVYEHAIARNACILAEIIGYGMSADAHHITSPSGDGAYRVMRNTLKDGGVSPEEVDYINAHGTSTPPNDRNESAAIRQVFGDHCSKLAVSSTKSMMGHLLGAAGGVEGVISVLSLIHQIAPPTINLDNPDPECDLDYVPHKARPMPISLVLSNSFAFGGTNACILFKKYPD